MADDSSKTPKSKPAAGKAAASAKPFPPRAASPHMGGNPFNVGGAPGGPPPFAAPFDPSMPPPMPYPPGPGMFPPPGPMMGAPMPMAGNTTADALFANLGTMLRLGVDALSAALASGNQLLQGMTGSQYYGGYGHSPYPPHHGHMHGHHCCGHYRGDHYRDSYCHSCCDVCGHHCCTPSVHNCC